MKAERYLRLARVDDIPDLMRFARNFHFASPYKTMRFDPAKTEKMFRDVISGNQLDGIVLLALQDDKPIGFLAGMANEPVFSRAKISMELAWWIEPDCRRTRASFLIYSAYEDWARRVGCHYVQGAYLPGVSPELDEFYKKRGYHRVESSYIKTLKFQGLDLKGSN